jgi:hypothetical protein
VIELKNEGEVGRKTEVDISLDGRYGARAQTALCRAAGRRFRPIILHAKTFWMSISPCAVSVSQLSLDDLRCFSQPPLDLI